MGILQTGSLLSLFENKQGNIYLLQFVASASLLVTFQTSSPDNIFLE
jgi:hypothetical protein